MRVLFLSTPQAKDLLPMVPLAWALRANGHDVRIATSGPALAVAGGLPVVDFGPADPGSAEAMPELAPGHRKMVWSRLRTVEEGWPVLGYVASTFVDPMLRAAREFRPDLVVHSQLQGAGLVTAAALGVPAVEHGFGLLRTGRFYDELAGLVPATLDRLGMSAGDLTAVPRAVIDIAPPSMVEAQEGAWPMRHVPHNGGGVVPEDLRTRPEGRARVAVTLGSMGLIGPDADAEAFLGRFLPLLGDLARRSRAEFVLIGIDPWHLDPTGSGGGVLSGGVRCLSGWVPLRELLDGCAAILHQGGAGTTLNALDAGLPQLAVPAVAPNFMHSVLLQDRGVGRWVTPDELDGEAIERLLSDEGARAAAREVREEMAGMPAPLSLVERVEALAR
ncbi:nucleotide disphospho-sugar-binding domain-containing protein [Umezawaea beigongshangensis]|uniref:nucleotide disphospho-sugar-binding domain-containing protein n=1 Tax=Umezawaea beigongshangensis TaxID=2780383 RepID=UPI0018F1DF8D|nr:nucleotide disphospho-sugar-binding domain-containing protein [Umezawaea beigongshangensis]